MPKSPTIAGALLLTAFLIILPSCGDAGKSDLVRRLESIFYDRDFTRIPDATFHVSDYGAIPDGKTVSTRAIQDAIDAAAQAGGGVVLFDTGTYLSGALFVKSNVEFRIDRGVTIRAIHDEGAYPDVWTRVAGIEMYWPAALINVYEQENVRITGEGTIDGNGKYWWDKFWGDPPRTGGMWTDYNARGIRWAVDYDCKRVRAVVVYDSRDVLLEDFRVERSGFWTVTLTYCTRVHVNGIVVRNNIGGYGPSSDGINTDSSKDILVENCDIDCNDDNLCIKSGRDADGLRVNRPAENIVYRNSVTRAGHGLFTLGSETSGGMRNIEVYGLEAKGTNTGIRFKSARVRGGTIENIWFHDIEMDQVASPFHFELDWYPSYSYPVIPDSLLTDSMPAHWTVMTTPVMPPEKGIPQFRDLRITRVNALNAGKALHVNAYPEKPMTNVLWEDVYIEAKEAGFVRHARDWNLEGVTMDIESGEKLTLENCVEVGRPEYAGENNDPFPDSGMEDSNPAQRFMAVLDTLSSWGNHEGLLMVFGRNGPLTRGDTIFEDTLRLVLVPGGRNEFMFYEPLGDGFYVTPVEISSGDEGSLLSAAGERSHHWKIYVKEQDAPSGFSGADQWTFHPDRNLIEASVTGSSFSTSLQ